MRYYLFDSYGCENCSLQIVKVKKGKELDIANFSVLSLPGAYVGHVHNFILLKIVVLFTGDNDRSFLQ